MSFSSITLEHREKQDQSEKSFLIYSLIGSLALHLGVLAFGLGNLLIDSPKVEDEPIEVAMVDEPTPSITKPPFEKKKPPQKEPPQKVDSGSGGNGVATQTPAREKTSSVPIAKQPSIKTAPVPAFKQPLSKAAPVEKLVDNFKTPPQPQPVATMTPQITPSATQSPKLFTTPSVPLISTPTPVASPTQKFVDNFKTPPAQPQPVATMTPKTIPTIASSPEPIIKSNLPLNNTPRTIASPTQLPQVSGGTGNRRRRTMLADSPRNGVGNGTGNGVGTGVGNGTGNGVGNGFGNGVGNGKLEGERVATAPKLPTPPTPKPKPTRLNFAKDCIKCEIKYPDRAKQQGIEGSPEVTIDYDENGNVTNVRLTQPSGKSELDQALVEQAREFILKPVPGGRVGARVVAHYQIRGSERDREYQARQRKREEQARQRETLTNTPNGTQQTPQGSFESTPGVITDVPGQTTSKRRRRSLTPSSPQTPATNPDQ